VDIDFIGNQSGFDPREELNANTSNDFTASFDFYDSYAGVHSQCSTRNNYNNGLAINSYRAVAKLNNTNRLFTHENCIDVDTYNANDFYQALDLLMCSRRVTYSVSAFSPHFGLFLGDDLLVNRTKLSQVMRVIGMQKKESGVELKLFDLKDFPLF
jgi:hypothetical protein